MSLPLDPDRTLRRIRALAWGSAAAMAGLGGLLWGVRFSASAIAGALIALVNYGAIEWISRELIRRRPRHVTLLAAVWVALRYVLLGLILYAIFMRWRANVVAVILGLSAPVVAVFVELALESGVELVREEKESSHERRGKASPAPPGKK